MSKAKMTAEQYEHLVRKIAVYFHGWTLDRKGEISDYRWKLTRGNLGFSLTLTHENRIHVCTWDWPSYTNWNEKYPGDNGYKKVTIYPRDLYDPKGESPDITVSPERDPEVIAKDIKKRFLIPYIETFQRCQLKADQSQEYVNLTRDTWQRTAALFDKDSSRGVIYAPILGDYNATITRNGGATVKLEMSLTPEQLARIVELFKDERTAA